MNNTDINLQELNNNTVNDYNNLYIDNDIDNDTDIHNNILIDNDTDNISNNMTNNMTNNTNNLNIIQHKINTQIINNGWNNKNEKLCVEIGEKCEKYKLLHEQCISYYNFLYTSFNILLIMFSTGLSAEITLNNSSTHKIIRTIITYLVNIFTVIQNFIQFPNKIEKHQLSLKEYSKIYNDIKYQLCIYRKDRINAEKFLSNIIKKSDDLLIKSPPISYFILWKSNINIHTLKLEKNNKIDIITENSNDVNINTNNNTNNNINNNTNNNTINNTINNSRTIKTDNLFTTIKMNDEINDYDTLNIHNQDIVKIKTNVIKKKIEYELNRFLEPDLI